MSQTAFIVNKRKLEGLLALENISKTEFCSRSGISRSTLNDLLSHSHEPKMMTVRRLLAYWGSAIAFEDLFKPNPAVEVRDLEEVAA
jgi:transcriptional regulator with XRE-family HTH domain